MVPIGAMALHDALCLHSLAAAVLAAVAHRSSITHPGVRYHAALLFLFKLTALMTAAQDGNTHDQACS
jgi:hypothetical protein